MIVVNCSQCRARLEMDDAFAGGVCRCHFCGTIQTVSAQAKLGAPGQSPAPAAIASARRTGTAGATAKTADGLDALAQAVASSQSRAGMRVAPQTPTAPPAAPAVDYARPPRQKTLSMPLIVALAVIVLLLGLVGLLVVGGSNTAVTGPAPTPSPTPTPTPSPFPTGTPPGNVNTTRAPPQGGAADGGTAVTPPPAPDADVSSEAPVPRTPNFCGIDLAGIPSVVYVLDRGQATAELFDTLKEAAYHSVESLKPGQKFQIIFWDAGGEITAYPPDGLAPVSPGEVENARTQFADVIAGGRATPEGAIQRAVQSRPAAIVLVTGKAFDLEPDLVKSVDAALGGAPIRVHTVALKTDDGNPVLKQIADKTRGEFRVVTGTQLRKFSY